MNPLYVLSVSYCDYFLAIGHYFFLSVLGILSSTMPDILEHVFAHAVPIQGYFNKLEFMELHHWY
jgi:hypothetical protein